jgi:hypothetical protein
MLQFQKTGDPIKSLGLGMGFVQELQKQEVNNSSELYRHFKQINAGSYKMSIQGSSGHYCNPRTVLSVDQYSEMEIAIFDNENNWLNIMENKVLKDFPRYNELMERCDGESSPCPVFGYVTVDLINDLYLYL